MIITTPRCVRVRISGRVQGVGYRDWAVQQARALGLTGWVRNCRDGSVEVLLLGTEVAIGEMLSACRIGPTLARVDQMVERLEEVSGPGQGLEGFCRLPSV